MNGTKTMVMKIGLYQHKCMHYGRRVHAQSGDNVYTVDHELTNQEPFELIED